MNTTVNILCYKSKTLANGEHPLMLSIYKEGKRKYLSLGLSVKAENWDFKKNKPKKSCPKKELIQKIINDNIEKYSSQILEFKVEDREYTTISLIERINQPELKRTVLELLNDEIIRLRSDGSFDKHKFNNSKYAHVVIGRFSEIAEGVIFTSYEIVPEIPKWVTKRGLGMDFEFTHDPTAVIDCALYDEDLYLDELCYKTHMSTGEIIRELKNIRIEVGL